MHLRPASLLLVTALTCAAAACSPFAIGVSPTPTASPTRASVQPSSTPLPTFTPLSPVVTATPSATATQPPMPTATPTSSPTATVSPPTPTAMAIPSPTRTTILVGSAVPTATPGTGPSLIIRQFDATMWDSGNQKNVVFRWDTEGATWARIDMHTSARNPLVLAVPPTGTYSIMVPDDSLYANPLASLTIGNDARQTASLHKTLVWPCRHTFFFTPAPPVCAQPAFSSPAAEQRFQNGRMIWIQKDPAYDYPRIYVLFDDGRYHEFPDGWKEGDPAANPQDAPSGLWRPTRGFGKVWEQNPQVRERIGWALAQERGFTTTAQRPKEEFWPWPLFVSTLDGSVVELDGEGRWIPVVSSNAADVPPLMVTVSPSHLSLPAGASGLVTAWVLRGPVSGAPLRWSVSGLPTGIVSVVESGATPTNVTVRIHTTCTVPPGFYPFDIIVEGGSGRMSARVYLTVTMPLGESGPGTDYGRFSTNTIEIRKGGPSTLTFGPYMVLSFCDSPQPRRLKATLRSIVSEAGIFMDRPIRFSLFQLLTWPLPQTLQTVGGAYQANASQVATSTEWQLEWPIRGGVYILTFDQSPLERNAPPMQRPGVLLVSVDVR